MLRFNCPLKWLTKTGVHFKWTEKCQARFERLRDLIANNISLRYYDPAWKNCVNAYYRPDGAGMTVTQEYVVDGIEKGRRTGRKSRRDQRN